MIVYRPNPNNPLIGAWQDLPAAPPVRPSVVRAIFTARLADKRCAGFQDQDAANQAAADAATMLRLSEAWIRRVCRLEGER